MIEINVRFWTDDIAPKKGNIIPKHAWTCGVVRVQRNEAHGIVPTSPIPINSLLSMPEAVERVLLRHGVTLHPGRTDSKYLKDKKPAKWKLQKSI